MKTNTRTVQVSRIFALLIAIVLAVLLGPTLTRSQQPTANITIDHVALNVADLETSVSFYTGVLGLQEIPAAAKGRRWLSLGPGIAIHLLGGRTAPVADNRSVHLALTTNDLEPIMQRLKERKVTWSDFSGASGSVGAVRTDGVRQIFFRDPDGYWIEVNDAGKKAK